MIITEHLRENSTIIEQILQQGHEIANHGIRDRQTSDLSRELFEKDFQEADEKLVRLSHYPIRWCRLGRAFYNQIMLDILRQFGGYEPRFALASMIPLDTFKLTVLARRSRSLLFDAQASMSAALRVGHLLASELGWDEAKTSHEIERFQKLAAGYILEG